MSFWLCCYRCCPSLMGSNDEQLLRPKVASARGHVRHAVQPTKNRYSNYGGFVEPSAAEHYDFTGKVMLLGDSGVGKTCLLVRFKDSVFLSGNYISTVGIDFRNKVVDVDDMKIKLQIWDTAGQERFRSVTSAYYRDAHALLLLYDVTNKASFENTRAWLSEIEDCAKKEVVIMLLGNKADMDHKRVVSIERGQQLARDYNIAFMESSAKTGLNVDLAFQAVAKDLKAKSVSTESEPFRLKEYVQSRSQLHKGKRCGCS